MRTGDFFIKFLRQPVNTGFVVIAVQINLCKRLV